MTDIDEGEMEAGAEEVARAVAERHVGVPEHIAPLRGGLSNLAFDVATDRERVAVRLADDPTKVEGFQRERQAADHARAAGVPTQEVVALGREGQWAYTISRRLAGEPGVDHTDRLRILEELGRLARLIHGVPTIGFGARFGWVRDATDETPPGCATWAAFLHQELDAGVRLARLVELEMISGQQERALRDTLADVERWEGAPVLNHGDLRLKNVVVDADAQILAVIDWESSISALGPHWDLSIALHDLSIDAKQAFLKGYGLPYDEVRGAAPVWRLFNLLNYVPTIDQLVEANDVEELDRMRTRLSGALDLYGADV